MTVIVDAVPSVASVFIGVHTRAGLAFEPDPLNGISHFVEHMMFKGTAKRDYQQIAEQVENIGGEINAATSMERTYYYIRSLKEHLEFNMEMLSDLLLNSLFDPREVEKEREVILQEYFSSLDDPESLVWDYFFGAAYGGQPLGRTLIGTRETIRAITAEDMKAYVAARYRAGDMAVIVSGNVDIEAVFDMAEKYFGGFAAGAGSAVRCNYEAGARIVAKDLEQANVVIGFDGVGADSSVAEQVAQEVALLALGGGMSSRLFQRVREEKNLAYHIGAGMNVFNRSGLASISFATEEAKLAPLLDECGAVVQGLCDGGITDAELSRAKVSLRASALMGLESLKYRAAALAKRWQVGEGDDFFARRIAAVDALTGDEALAAARRVFSSSACVGAVGRIGNLTAEGVKKRFVL